MLRKLLRTNINPWQTAAYAVANLVGLLIAGLGLQVYFDIRSASSAGSGNPLDTTGYIVVNRDAPRSLFASQPTPITPDDIRDIAAQPWASRASLFTPSGFDVTVSIDFPGSSFSTALFFEGVADEFLDEVPHGWQFDPANPSVAIILPADYLALYNFGFAPARGLPHLDRKTVSMAPLRVTLSGNGLSASLPGRVVGFSSRINTIAVPVDFISWANARFAPDAATPPANRAIIEITDPGNPAIESYLQSHSLSLPADNDATSRLSYFLRIVTAVVMTIGALISLLSLGMLLLSVFLLLQKSRATISLLLMLGYSPRQIAAPYILMIAIVNLAVTAIAAIATALCASAWSGPLADLGLHAASPAAAIIILIATGVILTAFSALVVVTSVRRTLSRSHSEL